MYASKFRSVIWIGLDLENWTHVQQWGIARNTVHHDAQTQTG